MMSYWSQFMETAPEEGNPPVMMSHWREFFATAPEDSEEGKPPVSVRKFAYTPQTYDSSDEEDGETSDAELDIASEQAPGTSVEPQGPWNPKSSTHYVLQGVRPSEQTVSKEKWWDAAEEARKLIADFCNRTSVTRVAPTDTELDELWGRCGAIGDAMSNEGKAHVSTEIIQTLMGLFSVELIGQEWKPQLRALCLLQFLFGRGGIDRFIAENAISESSDVLQHLSTEVLQCREKARQILELCRHAENVPSQDGLVVDIDGGIRVRQIPVADADDQETSTGSSSQADSSSEMEEPYVTAWPATPNAAEAPPTTLGLELLNKACADEDPIPVQVPSVITGRAESATIGAPEDCTAVVHVTPSVCIADRACYTHVPPSIQELHAAMTAEPLVMEVEPPSTIELATAAETTTVHVSAVDSPSNELLTTAAEVTSGALADHLPLKLVEPQPVDSFEDAFDMAFSQPADPFSVDMSFAELFDPFASLAQGSLLSVVSESSVDDSLGRPKGRAGSDDSDASVGSTRSGSIVSTGSLEQMRSAVASEGAMELYKPLPCRKTMPVIHWGIEDELEAPVDPFASLINL